MDVLLQSYVNIAYNLIKQKTNLEIPLNIIDVERMVSKNTRIPMIRDGYFNAAENKIRLNPSLIKPYMLSNDFKELVVKLRNNIPLQNEKELNLIYHSMNNSNFLDALSVIIHEYGHWIHYTYYYNQSFRIPISFSTRPAYAKRNPRENFAVAFEEYILDLIPVTSKRYIKIKNIIENTYKLPQ